jgi:MFS family permease
VSKASPTLPEPDPDSDGSDGGSPRTSDPGPDPDCSQTAAPPTGGTRADDPPDASDDRPSDASDPARRRTGRVLRSAATTFDALRLYNYRIYFSAAMVSNIGTWMQRVAQDWFVLELTKGSDLAGVAVGITTALQFLPILLFTPYFGLLADRIDKRKVLWIAQAWMALSSAGLGILAISGNAAIWHVFMLAFAFGLGTALYNPARQSFVSELTGPEHLSNAISLNSASFNTARMIGPAIAGLTIAAFGSGWSILMNAVSYLPMLVALPMLDAARLYLSERPRKAKRQIREGIGYVRRRPEIVVVLCVVFFIGTFGMKFQMTSALMAQQVFHRQAAAYGILGTFLALGSLTGALLSARRKNMPRLRFIVAAAVAFTIVEIVVGTMPTYWSYAAMVPLLGLASMLTVNAANVSIQLGVDPRLRGRVMALYMMLLQGGTPLGAPLLGWAASTFGARWTLIGGGGVALIGVVVAVSLIMAKQGIRLDTDFRLRPRPRLALRTRSRS